MKPAPIFVLATLSPRLQTLLAKSRQSIQAGKGLSSGDFWKAMAARRLAQSGEAQERLRSIRTRRSGHS